MMAISVLLAAVVSAAPLPPVSRIFGNPASGRFVVQATSDRLDGATDLFVIDERSAVRRKLRLLKGERLVGIDEQDDPVVSTESLLVWLKPTYRAERGNPTENVVIGDVGFTANDSVVSFDGRIEGYFERTASFHGFAPLPDRPEIVFTTSLDRSAVSVAAGYVREVNIVRRKTRRAAVRRIPLLFKGRKVSSDPNSLQIVGLPGRRAALWMPAEEFPRAALARLPVHESESPGPSEKRYRKCLTVVSLDTGRVRPLAIFEYAVDPQYLIVPGTVGTFAVSGSAIVTIHRGNLVRTELPKS